MELYEALKSGTSAEELMATFKAELEAANARIAREEEEAERENLIKSRREILAANIYYYAETLLGEDAVKKSGITTERIEKKLLESEKEIMNIYNLTQRLEKTFKELKKQPIGSSPINDDDVINKFLKSLR